MNLPNRLTLSRMILVPFFVAALYAPMLIFPGDPTWVIIARVLGAAFYLIAVLTDLFDGKIARKRGIVTDFGKLFDPMADKIINTVALIAVLDLKMYMMNGFLAKIFAFVVATLICRDVLVSSLRMLAADKGVVVAAVSSGKIKMITQTVMIMTILLEDGVLFPAGFNYLSIASTIVAFVVTVYSAFDYYNKNKQFISKDR